MKEDREKEELAKEPSNEEILKSMIDDPEEYGLKDDRDEHKEDFEEKKDEHNDGFMFDEGEDMDEDISKYMTNA